MVQLKEYLKKGEEKYLVLFQFLNGTIKRTSKTVNPSFSLLFQFLNGTIKSVGFVSKFIKPSFRFNS